MSDTKCPSCLNGCGGVRSDCPQREGGPLVRPAIGRPSSYTDDVAEAILDLMIEKGQGLIQITAQPGMPSTRTVYRWLESNEAFRHQYARAREIQAHVYAEETRAIVDSEPDAALARVKLDQRKWHASKLNPRVYGDKITQEHTGPGGGPMTAVVLTVDDPIEAAKQYQRLMGE